MDIDKVEFEGEDITEEVVAVEPEVEEVVDLAETQYVDIHANADDEDVKRELTPEEEIEIVFPLPERFPTKDEIDAWRHKYGRIRIRRVGPREAYVLRPLQRGEVYIYEKLVSEASGLDGYERIRANLEIEEAITARCMLYPVASQAQLHGSDPEFENPVLVGGTIGYLAMDILVSSNLLGESPTVVEDL